MVRSAIRSIPSDAQGPGLSTSVVRRHLGWCGGIHGGTVETGYGSKEGEEGVW